MLPLNLFVCFYSKCHSNKSGREEEYSANTPIQKMDFANYFESGGDPVNEVPMGSTNKRKMLLPLLLKVITFSFCVFIKIKHLDIYQTYFIGSTSKV